MAPKVLMPGMSESHLIRQKFADLINFRFLQECNYSALYEWAPNTTASAFLGQRQRDLTQKAEDYMAIEAGRDLKMLRYWLKRWRKEP